MNQLISLSRTELTLFRRTPTAVVFTFLFPLILLVVLAGIFGNQAGQEEFDGIPPTDFYLASYVGITIAAFALIALPVHLAAYRETGVLRRFRAAGAPTWAYLGSHAIVEIAVTAVASALMVAVGVFGYDAALPKNWGAAIGAFLLAAVSFVALGIAIGMLSKSARVAQAIGLAAFFPMWLLSGGGPPPNVMGSGLETVANFMPLTYAVRALQDGWLGRGLNPVNLIVLIGTALVSAAVAVVAFHRATTR